MKRYLIATAVAAVLALASTSALSVTKCRPGELAGTWHMFANALIPAAIPFDPPFHEEIDCTLHIAASGRIHSSSTCTRRAEATSFENPERAVDVIPNSILLLNRDCTTHSSSFLGFLDPNDPPGNTDLIFTCGQSRLVVNRSRDTVLGRMRCNLGPRFNIRLTVNMVRP